MLQKERLTAGVFWSLYSLAALGADAHCSLAVTVVSPRGNEVEARVIVQESRGRVIEKQNVPGGVRFCDLGILPVTVVVGRESCNQVTVRNVPLAWGKTYTLKVTYDTDPCVLPHLPLLPLCDILFRVADDEGTWIEGAAITILSPSPRAVSSDRYGRTRIRVPIGADVRGNVSKTGYRPAAFAAQCTAEELKVERELVLDKE